MRTIYSKLIEKQSICLPKHTNIYHPNKPKVLHQNARMVLFVPIILFGFAFVFLRFAFGVLYFIWGNYAGSRAYCINFVVIWDQRDALSQCFGSRPPTALSGGGSTREFPHSFTRISLCLIRRHGGIRAQQWSERRRLARRTRNSPNAFPFNARNIPR